jgi:NAD(P)-dependent dehydrogenase (short-subunit alcohol dehydrogenase family)
MMRLKGKVAIISGAAHGMGSQEAKLFAKEGAKVVIADVLKKNGKQVETEITEAGGEALFLQLDVTCEEDWKRVMNTTVSHFGKLDILVNNAGVTGASKEDPTSIEEWHRVMAVNLTGVFLGTKYAVQEMIRTEKGSIVNISSIMGMVGSEFVSSLAYPASKAGVRNLTKATAVKYGANGIRANSVHPGWLSPMLHSQGEDEIRHNWIAQTPLGREGHAIEVAYGVLFLASDEASFITGSELVIDGGFLAH